MTNDTLIEAAERCGTALLASTLLAHKLQQGEAPTAELIAEALHLARAGRECAHQRAQAAARAVASPATSTR